MGVNVLNINKNIDKDYGTKKEQSSDSDSKDLVYDEEISMFVGYETGMAYDISSSIGSSLSDAN